VAADDRRAGAGGLQVRDVPTFLAGPFCATQLDEFDADIINVDSPDAASARNPRGVNWLGMDLLTMRRSIRGVRA